jgi:hypothetical protein
MKQYTILQNPGHNRVYYNLADKMALAELKLAARRFSVTCSDVECMEVAGIRYIAFKTDAPFCDDDWLIISRLSFVFAIFELESSDGKINLIPVQKTDYEYLDAKISSLLKYPGKTNELFTKMMVNVALLSSSFKESDDIRLLDPVAGKGTTLFEGAVYGFNVFGIELEPKSVHEARVFFKKYLEAERLKHKANTRQIAGASRKDATYMQEFEYALSKEAFNEDKVKKLGLINGSATHASSFFKKESIHLIVGDLPYGIAHGNTREKKGGSVTRNPSGLLNECLPEWHKILMGGGAVVLAWNAFVVSRKVLEDLFIKHGYKVYSEEPYNEFEHQVDKSIKRDIIVAQKKQ